MDDFFPGVVYEKPSIRTNLFACIVPTVGDQFKVQLIFEVAFMFIKQFGDDAAVTDGFENRIVVCDFARHKVSNFG